MQLPSPSGFGTKITQPHRFSPQSNTDNKRSNKSPIVNSPRKLPEKNEKKCEKIGFFISSGSSNNRPVYLGPRGGIFYMSSGQNPVYLNEEKQDYCVNYL